MIRLVRSSILAGIAIGCGGFGFLASGIQAETFGPLFGSILFSFGLMTVVAYKLALYTGTAGFIKKNEIGRLFVILGGNIIGCICMGLISRCSPMDIQSAAQNVLNLRLERGPICCGLLGIPCGFMMTTAVTFARCFLLQLRPDCIPESSCPEDNSCLCQHSTWQSDRLQSLQDSGSGSCESC